MLAYVPLDVLLIYLVVKFDVLTLREAVLAMSQSGCTGRPSKHPKLVRHTLPDPNQPSNHVDRHRIFSLQPSSQIALQTSYIPASSLEKEDKNIPSHTVPTGADSTMPTDYDPWNEMMNTLRQMMPLEDLRHQQPKRHTVGKPQE
jgi:hypothetical protein